MPSRRRMTLGPVSPNRTSAFVGGGTPSAEAKKKSKRGRVSMMPRMAGGRELLAPSSPPLNARISNRRKSVAGDNRRKSTDRRQTMVPPPPPPVKTDPRHISDKAYQNSCIKRLLQYLLTSGYDNPVNTKSLTRPSGKDFQNIVTFMLRRIDPTFIDGTMKLEDEVAMHFKALGYPFPISKTALVAAGSPHTWPALLAALTWLMELLQTAEENAAENEHQLDVSETFFESLEELEQKNDKAFFKYLGRAYVAFLQGDTDLSQRLEEELVDMFEKDNMVLEREIERITDLNAAIVEKINRLGEETEDLATLEKKRNDYATDVEQFHDLVRQMDEHKEAIEKKVKERTAQFESKNQELQAVTARVQTLKDKIQAQDLSVDDVRKMKNEHNRLVEAMDRVSALKQQHSKALWDAEAQLAKVLEELENTVNEYNARMADISLFSGLKYKAGLKTRNAHEKDQRLLLGVVIHSEVVPALNHCKADYTGKITDARKEHQELLDKVEATEAALTEALDGLKIAEGKRTKYEEMLSREREEQEGALEVRKRELASTESKIASLRDPVALEEAIARYQRQCVELEALQMKHQEANIARKQAFQDEIKAAMRAVKEHKQYQQNKLAELQQYILTKKASVGTVEVPSTVTLKD